MILVDTSVWIDHLRRGDPDLAAILEGDRILMHPFVVGELACGTLRNRRELLTLWSNIPAARQASDDEALLFIEGQNLAGLGLGYIDVHLLASVALSAPAKLWTKDRQLCDCGRAPRARAYSRELCRQPEQRRGFGLTDGRLPPHYRQRHV